MASNSFPELNKIAKAEQKAEKVVCTFHQFFAIWAQMSVDTTTKATLIKVHRI